MQSEFPESEAPPVADHLPTQHAVPAAPVEPTTTHMPVPHEVREIPLGPAVVPEPWTPAPRIPDAQAPVSPGFRTYDPLHLDHPYQPLPARFRRCRDSLRHRRTRQPVPLPQAGPSRSAPRFLARAPRRPSPSHHRPSLCPSARCSAPHGAVKPDRRPRTGSPASNCSRPVNQVHQQQNPPPTQLPRPHRQPRHRGPRHQPRGPSPLSSMSWPAGSMSLSPRGCGRSCGWTVNEQE